MRRCVLAILLVLAPEILLATTINVPADQPTIQAGVLVASPGDTVLVDCGTYLEHDIPLPDGVFVLSASGDPDCVVIDAQLMGRVFLCDSTNPTIEGITITGGQVELNGGGVNLYNSTASFSNCMFIGNSCTDWENSRGGAVYSEHSSPVFNNCEFINNTCGAAGAVYCKYGAPEFINCMFEGNHASGGGALIGRSASVACVGCTFIGNTATTWGGAIFLSFASSPVLTQCTFYGNEAASVGGGALYCMENIAVEVDNSILWGNLPEEIIVEIGSSVQAQCSNIQGGWDGAGNIDLDPVFCDPDLGDFTLRNDSPCAPENNDCGVLMGAWPVGCSTSTSSKTWSAVKALY